MSEKMIRIGKITNCHGVKGELVLQPLTDDNRRFKKLKQALLELPGGRYEDVTVSLFGNIKKIFYLLWRGLLIVTRQNG